MMKGCFLVLFIILSGVEGQAQFDTASVSKNVYASEDSMIALFKRKDWNSYAGYMNTVLIDLMGGKESFVQYLQAQMKALENADIQVVKTGKILQLLKMNDQYQCIVESFLQMKFNGLTVSGSSYDIGISGDGFAWTFFRITETATQEQIKKFLPDLSQEFKLPRSQMELKTLEEFMATYVLQYLN